MSFRGVKFNFPECVRWTSQFDQAYKVRDEAVELVSAQMDKADTVDHQIEECLDVMWACETYLRHCDIEKVKDVRDAVLEKNRCRGYVR